MKLIFCFVFVFTPVSAQHGECTSFPINQHDHCWLFSTVHETWSNAKATCEDYGGHLLVESDNSVTDAVITELQSHDLNLIWWIALRKKVDPIWTWPNGDAIGKWDLIPIAYV